MSHPSSIALEAFACGESDDVVRMHVTSCPACETFIVKITGASAKHASDTDVEAMLGKAAIRALEMKDEPVPASPVEEKFETRDAEVAEPEEPKAADAPSAKILPFRARLLKLSYVAVPFIAAAAGILLFLKTAPQSTTLPLPSHPSAIVTPVETTADPVPETSFKGGIQIAVVRERSGDQRRFTSEVPIHDGDRIRIEVALDRSQTIIGGVLADDGTFVELMPVESRGAGTHFSENAVHFDADPTHGYVIAGTPDAIARSRAAGKPVDVSAVRLDWEGR